MAKFLSRRTILRGAAGAIVGLPMLECMLNLNGNALAQGIAFPNRWVSLYGGHSLATSETGKIRAGILNSQAVIPDIVGSNYDLKVGLSPFANYNNIRSEISVVSGLLIPWASLGGGPGGRADAFHESQEGPLFRGTSGTAESADQIAAKALNAVGTQPTFKSFAYRAQATSYKNGQGVEGLGAGYYMTYRRDPDGAIRLVRPTVSPQQAFKDLFGTFIPPEPIAANSAALKLQQRLSVLDLVSQGRQDIVAKVGASDRRRLDQHFDEIRDLERRVAAAPPPQTGSCQKPADPGPDPAVGKYNLLANNGIDDERMTFADKTVGYSDEASRARIFSELIRMAFACDLVRAGSLMLTASGSGMNMYAAVTPSLAVPTDLHSLTHGSNNYMNEPLARAIAWHTNQYAYLVSLLRDTPEGAGRLLDRCALTYMCEGGFGYDPEGKVAMSPHSSENVMVLLAGRAGGLKAGQHIVAKDKHPGSVVLSALNAVGVQSTTFGQVSGTIPKLFT